MDAPLPMSLAEHIAAEEAPAAAATAAPVAPIADDTTPDPDVEASPDLKQEIDALEPPKPEETPAEKAARTKRHKASAQKGLVSRLANQRDKERTRASDLEREVLDLRRRLEPTPPAAQPPPQPARAAQPAFDGSDPADPVPTMDQFGDQPDPFVAWTAARTDWAARREIRKDQYARHEASVRATVQQSRVTALRAFDTHATELRKTEPGFDAAIEHLTLTPPMQAVIFGSGETGPALALALAKDPALHQRLLSLPPAAQFVELGAFKATVQARHAAPAAPPPTTQAPPPPSALASGAAAASAAIDTTKPGTKLSDHIAVEEAEIADRRKRGHRF